MDNLDDDYYNFHDKQGYYRGSARVRLENLAVEGLEVRPTRTVDDDHVQHLIDTFHTEGCDNLDPKHRVKALIRDEDIGDILQASEMTVEEFMQYIDTPKTLSCGDRLFVCLEGRHRIKAARRFFNAEERWWAVDFYSFGQFPNNN